jgi:hypothetical protein
MTFAEYESIPVGVLRTSRADAEDVVVQDAYDLDDGKGRCDVPSASPLDGANDVPSQFEAARVQLGRAHAELPVYRGVTWIAASTMLQPSSEVT